MVISTHALTEGDALYADITEASITFQLTPSRRATGIISWVAMCTSISTHALTEGDCKIPFEFSHPPYFNSRPHGGRLPMLQGFHLFSYFNSRPHGGRPCEADCSAGVIAFQLTPSRRATKQPSMVSLLLFHFNSRPHGGRRQFFLLLFGQLVFQLTPSRRATLLPCSVPPYSEISTHALTEGDCTCESMLCGKYYFNSRPHGGRRTAPACCS